MEIKQLSNGRVEISTDSAHVIRKKGDKDPTGIRRRRVNADELDQWEEVAVEDLPPYTTDEYDAKVDALVKERYAQSEENAIMRKLLNALLHPEAATLAETDDADDALPKEIAQFEAYNAYVEDCKLRAKDPALYVREEPEAPAEETDVAEDVVETEDGKPTE